MDEELRQKAEALIRDSASEDEFNRLKELSQLIEELRIYQIELELQNQELRTSQQELERMRDKYSYLYNSTPVGYFTFDQKGIVLEVNLTGAVLLKTERKFLLNQPFVPHVVVGWQDAFFLHLRDVLENKTRQVCELKLRDQNGLSFYVQLESVPFPNDDGEFMDVGSAIIDISAQKEVERLSRETIEDVRTIFNNVYDAIFIYDLDGTIIDINAKVLELYRISYQQALKHAIDDFFVIEGASHPPLAGREINESEVRFFEGKARRIMDDSVFEVNVHLQKIYFRQREAILATVRDITEQKEAEKTLAWQANINKAIAELSKALLSTSSLTDISKIVLRHAKTLTNSQFGFVGYIDPNTGFLISPTLTHEIWDSCPIQNKQYIFKEYRGLWGWIFTHHQPLVTNQPEKDTRSSGVPEGHVPIKRFMGVPALIGDVLVGEVALANSESDYTERDLTVVERLADLYAIAIQRYHADRALQESEEKFRELSNLLPQTVFEIDLEGNLLFTNQYGIENFGYTQTEFEEGLNAFQMLIPEEHSRLKEHMQRKLKGEGIDGHEYIGLRKNGETFPVLIYSNLVMRDGEPVGFRGISIDITEQKRVESELKQAKEIAEIANKAKNEFLANVSHELRTPLNAILGYTQILKKNDNLTEQQQYYIDTIQHGGEHLLTLINDILDLSKIETGRIELEPSEFMLDNFLNTIIKISRIQIQRKKVEFNLEISPQLAVTVYGDEKRLRQILLNLLGNAVKFTDSGEITFRVIPQRKNEHNNDSIRFEVEDTGVGIPPEKLEVIFLPFRQHKFRGNVIKGMGLGLALSQRLARMMGSEIFVKSVVGQGSIFWFDLNLPIVFSANKNRQPQFIDSVNVDQKIQSVSQQEITKFPPLEDIEFLLNLAKRGDVFEIKDQIMQMEKSNPEYMVFLLRLKNLIRTFKIKEIREFLEFCLSHS